MGGAGQQLRHCNREEIKYEESLKEVSDLVFRRGMQAKAISA